ncbi:MAG: efflux RND transporter permease subunit [Mucinivorans sp.]
MVGGVLSFDKLGKKEDAPFVIKQVVLVTQYPGATPAEVELLVTEPIEREIQSMEGVYKITSESFFGMSKIQVELNPSTAPDIIPQKWDELRRKTLNVQPRLPSGASDIVVSDDFGDVFGIYYGMVAGEGYSYADMREWAQFLKRELVTVDGVQKVALFGEQYEVINMFISLSTLANLGVDPNAIVQTVQSQNQIINTGVKEAGSMSLTIQAAGTYTDLDDIRNQVVTLKDGSQVRLGDIAVVAKGYMEPANTMMFVSGKPAIGVGISTLPGRDVVKTGQAVEARLSEIMAQVPVGVEMVPLYMENQIAQQANNGFIVNLIESVVIVILIILLVMGWRAGVLIGSSLLFSIGGTMLIMLFMGVGLNRTSLAGFIIAMGMLVDNAIVVTDNAQVSIKRGLNRRQALINGAIIPQWGLLGATFIGVCSFLPLYLAPSAVAEIVKPLFIVLAISLGLSWVLALTQTPLFGNFMLKDVQAGVANKDPYDTKFYGAFDKFLTLLIRFRWVTVSVVVAMFIGSLVIMGNASQSFFPNMEKPYFKADCFLPDGYSINDTKRQMDKYVDWLESQPEVKQVSMTVGASPLRYYLASTSIGPKDNYGNLLIELYSADSSEALERRAAIWAKENLADVLVRSSLFKLSPAVEGTIEFGYIGSNIDTLEMLTLKTEQAMRKCPLVGNIRASWGNKVPVVTPVYSQEKGQRLGISRRAVAQYTTLSTSGMPMGEYRQGDQFMPILLKDASIEDFNLANFSSLPVFNPQGDVVSMGQVVDSIATSFEYSVIKRYNRQRLMMAQCDPLIGANAIEAYHQTYNASAPIREKMLPEGYEFKVFGEQETQDESNAALAVNMPLTLVLILVTLLLLFRTYRRPVIILLMLPLIFIGVVMGLAIGGKSLDFFATLGVLGLVGMNIKNAVVLVDQINIEQQMGLTPLRSVISATKSRIVPVVMASGTTILGMLPLLSDALFGGMAATIMGGLTMATILTILVLPVTYCLIMRIKS